MSNIPILCDVPEVGVPVPEIVLLLLGQALEAVVAAAAGAEAVLPDAVGDAAGGEDEGGELGDQVDGVADGEVGAVVGEVGPDGQDAAGGAEGHDPAAGDGADGGARGVVQGPGQEAGAAGEGAERAEVDGAVLEAVAGPPPQHREAGDAQQGEGREPDAAHAGLVADEGDGDGDGRGGHVHGDGVVLGGGGGPAELVEDRGHEDRQALHRDVDAEEAARRDVVVDVEEGPPDVVRLDLLVRPRLELQVQPLRRDPLLALRQVLGRVRALRQEERRERPDDHGHDALEEEDVAPRVHVPADAPGWDLRKTPG